MAIQFTDYNSIKGLKVTVMGLGLNGGGLASARFFAEKGAIVTATDLRDEKILAPTLKQLAGLPIKYTLGKHEISDFANADIVIKNPAVRKRSEFTDAAKQIETDISIFLQLCKNNPILAITGTKGKSTTVSALFHILKAKYPGAKLGGNITVSPLSFIDDVYGTDDPVVLELSSWQLADLPDASILEPKVALITNIMHDHQNHYAKFEDYVDDKRIIYKGQKSRDFFIANMDDSYGESFASETNAACLKISESDKGEEFAAFLNGKEGIIRKDGREINILPEKVKVPGPHNRLNMLFAACAAYLFGIEPKTIIEQLGSFNGIEHRLQPLGEKNGIRFYNDSAATLPDAMLAAVKSFDIPIYLITGGTDKELDLSPFEHIPTNVKAIYLLKGSATDRLKTIFDSRGTKFTGPWDDFQAVFDKVCSEAVADTSKEKIILLSPGAASFGMFLNEFDRGNRFIEMVKNYLSK